MKLNKDMKILIVGLGLIGGSYAEAISKKGYEVGAIDQKQEAIDFALRKGYIASGKTTKIADTCADGISIDNGKLYYIGAAVSYTNDYPALSDGDGRLYCYDGNKVTKLA